MKTPIELIQDRLIDITKSLKRALNNDLDQSDVNKILNHYNTYFTALQLLDSHSQIDHSFSRLYISGKKQATYKKASLKKHLLSVKKLVV